MAYHCQIRKCHRLQDLDLDLSITKLNLYRLSIPVSFTGRHTGDRIRDVFLNIMKEYEIESKVTHVISDNASNMRKAFSTMLPTSDEEMDEDFAVDNEDVR